MTEIPTVRRLLPGATDGGTADLSLPEAFAFPADARSPADAQSWVRAVFVASVDGAATVAGRAGGLGNDVDRAVFALNRALADVILVGAGTARTEEYGPAEDDFRWRGLREGRSPSPTASPSTSPPRSSPTPRNGRERSSSRASPPPPRRGRRPQRSPR